ncbi:hypothetical protein B0H19DRAFT_99014 [Mycena capillaripes]|nr:hypothetical protein B0H19DRAFT_99014 [Mycena capillaripes]
MRTTTPLSQTMALKTTASRTNISQTPPTSIPRTTVKNPLPLRRLVRPTKRPTDGVTGSGLSCGSRFSSFYPPFGISVAGSKPSFSPSSPRNRASAGSSHAAPNSLSPPSPPPSPPRSSMTGAPPSSKSSAGIHLFRSRWCWLLPRCIRQWYSSISVGGFCTSAHGLSYWSTERCAGASSFGCRWPPSTLSLWPASPHLQPGTPNTWSCCVDLLGGFFRPAGWTRSRPALIRSLSPPLWRFLFATPSEYPQSRPSLSVPGLVSFPFLSHLCTFIYPFFFLFCAAHIPFYCGSIYPFNSLRSYTPFYFSSVRLIYPFFSLYTLVYPSDTPFTFSFLFFSFLAAYLTIPFTYTPFSFFFLFLHFLYPFSSFPLPTLPTPTTVFFAWHGSSAPTSLVYRDPCT